MAENSTDRRHAWAFTIIGALLLISFLYYRVNPLYIYVVVYIWFGVAYGMLLQYGRFCMASAFRDLFAMGVTRMFVGIMIAMGIFSVLMSILSSEQMSTFHPGPIGIHELLGGLVFGVGMTFAGGCASGTLYKCGEGNGTSMMAFLGICFSQAIFVDVGGLFDRFLRDYVFKQPMFVLADHLPGGGFVANTVLNSLIPITLLLIVAYIAFFRTSFIKRMRKAGQNPGNLFGLWAMLSSSKNTTIAGMVLGVVAGLHVLAVKGMQVRFQISNFGEALARMGHQSDLAQIALSANPPVYRVFDPGYWYITSQEAQAAAWVLEKAGVVMHDNFFFGVMNGIPALWRNPALWMSIGIILGAATLALLNDEFKFKKPRGELIFWGLIGGTLMGLGARLALGCNVGAFFIRVAGGDPGGWIFAVGMGGGVLGGLKVMNWWAERKFAKQTMDLALDI